MGLSSIPPPPPPLPVFGKRLIQTHQYNQLPHYLKPKPKFDVGVPMKMAHWEAIKPQTILEQSFWAKCQENKLISEDILEGLAARFQSRPTKRALHVYNPLKTKKDVDLRILNTRSAQNVLVLLHSLLKGIPPEKMKQSILRCDTSVLTSSITEQLIRCLPPQDQIKRLTDIKKRGDELSKAEVFVATLGEIDGLMPRLQSINFKHCITDMIQIVEPNITDAIAACEEVKTSKRFAKILEMVLLFGNYMNSNSIYGQAHGFHISFMTKLKDTKDSNNKQTLLHYLAEIIEREIPESLDFGKDLHHAEKAARINFESIREIVDEMKTSLENLKSSLEMSNVSQLPGDKFVEVMSDFALESNEKVGALEIMMNKMEKCYKEVGEYFTLDTKKYLIGEFFTDIKHFKESFAQAYKEIANARTSQKKDNETSNVQSSVRVARRYQCWVKLDRVSNSGTYVHMHHLDFLILFSIFVYN